MDASSDEPLPSPVVLIAEDEPLLSLLLTEELTAAGYRVAAAGNGDEAIWQVREFGENFCAAVLDVGLGAGPSGYDVARALREKSLTLPIIFTTSHEAAATTAQSLRPALHVDKPYRMEEITQGLARLLG